MHSGSSVGHSQIALTLVLGRLQRRDPASLIGDGSGRIRGRLFFHVAFTFQVFLYFLECSLNLGETAVEASQLALELIDGLVLGLALGFDLRFEVHNTLRKIVRLRDLNFELVDFGLRDLD